MTWLNCCTTQRYLLRTITTATVLRSVNYRSMTVTDHSQCSAGTARLGSYSSLLTLRKDRCGSVVMLYASSQWWKHIPNFEQKKNRCRCWTGLITSRMNRYFCNNFCFLRMNVQMSCHLLLKLFKTSILKQCNFNIFTGWFSTSFLQWLFSYPLRD